MFAGIPQNDDLERGKAFKLATSSIYVACFGARFKFFVGGMGGFPGVGGGSKRNIERIKKITIVFLILFL